MPFVIIMALLVWLVVAAVKETKKRMRENDRTLWEEIRYESQNVSDLKSGLTHINKPMQSVVLPKRQPFVIPEGECGLMVYTYDGRPLANMPDGSRVTFTITPEKRTMRSIYTGTTWTESCALARNGYLVGFMGNGVRTRRVKSLARKHGYLLVYGRRVRTDARGWPVIELSLPEKSWFDQNGVNF